MVQYFDDKQRLVHEGAGVLVQNEEGALLFFLRTKYPFLWTIPGGHSAPSEDPLVTALRELKEEVGISLDTATPIFIGIIEGDECMGGADVHLWHLYHARVTTSVVSLGDEGSEYRWFLPSELPTAMTFPVQYLLDQDSVRSVLL